MTDGDSPPTTNGFAAFGAPRPVAVDLFAGAGGLSLGFEMAGFDLVAAVEYDPVHALVHRYNFPHCDILCKDVRTTTAADIRAAARRGWARLHPDVEWNGQIDALVGGPSCQGFSVGGLQDKDDERNGLLLEFVRLVTELKPRTFCLENVPGLLAPAFQEFRTSVWKQLREAGYSLSGTDGWLNAADFGVPQARKRVLVMGVLDAAAVDAPSPTGHTKVTVAEAFEGLPVIEAHDVLLKTDELGLTASLASERAAAKGHYARLMSGLAGQVGLEGRRLPEPTALTGHLRTVHSTDVQRRFSDTPQGRVDAGSRLFRLDAGKQARTLRAGTGRERGAHTSPRPIHPSLPRVITIREAARLHSYPDWFRFSATNWHGHRQIGNSVPPLLAKAAASQLITALRSQPVQAGVEITLGNPSWCRQSPSGAAALIGTDPNDLPAARLRKPS